MDIQVALEKYIDAYRKEPSLENARKAGLLAAAPYLQWEPTAQPFPTDKTDAWEARQDAKPQSLNVSEAGDVEKFEQPEPEYTGDGFYGPAPESIRAQPHPVQGIGPVCNCSTFETAPCPMHPTGHLKPAQPQESDVDVGAQNKNIRCIFCAVDFPSLVNLREHSVHCSEHPAVKLLAVAREGYVKLEDVEKAAAEAWHGEGITYISGGKFAAKVRARLTQPKERVDPAVEAVNRLIHKWPYGPEMSGTLALEIVAAVDAARNGGK